jgi:hypothetical protein
MKVQKFLIAILLLTTSIMTSCDQEDAPSGGDSRDVKYEMTGTYTGPINAAATTNNGIAEVVEIKKLPWTFEFKAKESIKSLFVTATGTGGSAGQTVKLNVIVGEKIVSTSNATALSTGIITVNSTLYNFK